jgi:hypothetical protein
MDVLRRCGGNQSCLRPVGVTGGAAHRNHHRRDGESDRRSAYSRRKLHCSFSPRCSGRRKADPCSHLPTKPPGARNRDRLFVGPLDPAHRLSIRESEKIDAVRARIKYEISNLICGNERYCARIDLVVSDIADQRGTNSHIKIGSPQRKFITNLGERMHIRRSWSSGHTLDLCAIQSCVSAFVRNAPTCSAASKWPKHLRRTRVIKVVWKTPAMLLPQSRVTKDSTGEKSPFSSSTARQIARVQAAARPISVPRPLAPHFFDARPMLNE